MEAIKAKQYIVRRNEDGTYYIFDKKNNRGSGDYPRKGIAVGVARRLNAGAKYIVGYCVFNVETNETTFTGFLTEDSAQETCDTLNAK